MEELLFIQAMLKAPKGQYNEFGKYKYRSCEDILEAVKPLLSSKKCYLNICDEVVLIGERYYVKATATLINKEGVSVSSTAFAREDETKKGMDGSQITGAASSYARKYALNGLLAIDDTKDADATNTHGKDVEKKEKLMKVPAKITDIAEALKAMGNYKQYEGGFKAVWEVIDPKLKVNNDVTNSAKEICAKIKKDGKA